MPSSIRHGSMLLVRQPHHAVYRTHHGLGPYVCAWCGKHVRQRRVTDPPGYERSPKMVVVHHIDGNRQNNAIENLQAMHYGCHIAHHRELRPLVARGSRLPKTWAANIGAANTGELNGFYGKKHTAVALKKMRKPRRREVCSRCGKEYALNWVKRHQREGTCRRP